jgi:Na+-driven multidrug efflux pump
MFVAGLADSVVSLIAALLLLFGFAVGVIVAQARKRGREVREDREAREDSDGPV